MIEDQEQTDDSEKKANSEDKSQSDMIKDNLNVEKLEKE